jgi:hypothetical protein
MKYLNKLLLIFIIINTTACRNTINQVQDSLSMDSMKRSELISQCNEIDSEGNIFELLKEIKGETDDALSILSTENLIVKRPDIEEIASSINDKSNAVISLSKNEWVTRKWDTEISWSLKRFNFDDILVNNIKDRFEIISAKLVDVYYLGEKRNDLIDYITISVTHDDFQIKDKSGQTIIKPENYMVNINYKNTASSLELCQLHQTMMIIVEVEYRNKLMKNKSVFNLNFKRDL